MSEYQEVIDKIKMDLSGYHLEIQIFRSGGIIDATGCDECGTDEGLYKSEKWSKGRKGKNKTLDDAVSSLKNKLISKHKEVKS